ncbi:hypothetical protein HOF65_05640 [bacterium]|nr:hypothetical protein [bacterium]MBT3853422.1 hypothetical protein [bacterium]MBT4633200.1 hypothetical protein [bacterium]
MDDFSINSRAHFRVKNSFSNSLSLILFCFSLPLFNSAFKFSIQLKVSF